MWICFDSELSNSNLGLQIRVYSFCGTNIRFKPNDAVDRGSAHDKGIEANFRLKPPLLYELLY